MGHPDLVSSCESRVSSERLSQKKGKDGAPTSSVSCESYDPTLSPKDGEKCGAPEDKRAARGESLGGMLVACLVRSQGFYGVDRGGATGRQIACSNCHQAQECGAGKINHGSPTTMLEQ